MSDRDAFLAAILANPDDDLPRLVYADWLDEHGSALPPPERRSVADRAAVIRAQVEAARAEPFSPAARAARERADRLLTPANREQWTWHLRGLVQDPEQSRFERGFVAGVTVDAAWFPETAAALFDLEAVRALRVTRLVSPEATTLLEPFFDLPRLREVTALDLSALNMFNVEYDALLASPHLDGLTDLSLRGNPVFPPWLAEFLTGPRLPGLNSLDLSDIPHLGPGLAAAVSHADRSFTRVDLSGIAFRSGDLMHVLKSSCLSAVEELRLGWHGGPANPGPLTHLEFSWLLPWEGLRLLDLAGQGFGPSVVSQIGAVPAAAGLRWLGLARNGLGPEGARLLIETRHLNLYHLDVRGNGMTVKDFTALQRRFPEARIEWA